MSEANEGTALERRVGCGWAWGPLSEGSDVPTMMWGQSMIGALLLIWGPGTQSCTRQGR